MHHCMSKFAHVKSRIPLVGVSNHYGLEVSTVLQRVAKVNRQNLRQKTTCTNEGYDLSFVGLLWCDHSGSSPMPLTKISTANKLTV